VPVMIYAPSYPWRLSVFWYRPPINPKTFRFRAGQRLMSLHLPKLAGMILDNGNRNITQVSGPQMEQWEK